MGKLFENFINPSIEEWYKQAAREIGSIKDLSSDSYEGISTKALYIKEDLAKVSLPEVTLKSGNNKWLYLEEIEVLDEKTANTVAIDALQNGADGVYFTLKNEQTDVEVLFNGIWIDNCIISFRCEKENTLWLKDFLTYYSSNYQNSGDLRGWISFSSDLGSENKEFKESFYKSLFDITSSFPNFCAITSDSASFLNRGSDIIREIAYTLSRTVDHIESSRNTGIMPERAIRGTLFSITVGTNYFFEISKLRSLRLLWTKIAEGYGIKLRPSDVQIHAKTSYWHKSSLDKENNIIRDAAEAMAAVIGGCNYLSFSDVFPLNGKEVPTTKRTSRNISHILKEESFLDKVIDPSGGSYYIEHLTMEIAERSWALFLEIEEEGGFSMSFAKNQIQESIEIKKQEKLRDLNLRNTLSIGTNIYPNLKEFVKKLDHTDKRATYEIEKLRGWVEQMYSERGTVLIGSWEGLSNKIQIDLLKNIFSSAGFVVEFQKDLKAFLQKANSTKYSLVLCLLDPKTLDEIYKRLLEEFNSQYSILFPGDSILENSIEQISIEELARPELLKKVLEKIIANKK